MMNGFRNSRIFPTEKPIDKMNLWIVKEYRM